MLSLEHSEFLLLVQWNLIIVIPRQPGVLQGGRRIIPLRGRVGAQVEEEILCKWSKVSWELPLDRFRFNILQLLVVVDLTWVKPIWVVAGVLSARQKLVHKREPTEVNNFI